MTPTRADVLACCPFCGGEAKISGTLAGVVYVGCNVRGCCGEGGDDGVLSFANEAEAIAAWNRRTLTSEASIIERCAKVCDEEATKMRHLSIQQRSRPNGTGVTASWIANGAESCAAAIRKLGEGHG